jgi:hypothetical protein
MIVVALPGVTVSTGDEELTGVYRDAGRDLARFAAVGVDGFGFVVRDGGPAWPPRAPPPTAGAALREVTADGPLDAILAAAATPRRLAVLDRLLTGVDDVVAHQRDAALAHGDVDPTHVFHLDGTYTGLIDLGELRGALLGDDLARVRLWSGSGPMLDALTAGYAQLQPLPDGHDRRTRALAALQGAQQLARWYVRGGPVDLQRPTARRLAGQVAGLLDELA